MSQKIHIAYKEYFVGGFLVVATLALVALFFATLLKNDIFTDNYTLRAVFGNKSDIGIGAKVKISGIPVGQVTDIFFNRDNKVEIALKVQSKYQYLIRKNSTAAIVQERFPISDRIISISPGDETQAALEDGMYIRSQEMLNLDEVLGQVMSALHDLSDIVGKLKRGEGTLGEIIQDDKLYRNLEGVTYQASGLLKQGQALTGDLRSVAGKTGALLDSLPSLTHSVHGTLDEVSGVLKSSQALLTSAADFIAKVNALADRFPELTDKGISVMGDAGDVLNAAKKTWPLSGKLNRDPDDPPIYADPDAR